MFPLKKYEYTIPDSSMCGGFGFRRKHDIHAGVDLYCNDGDGAYCIENGVVVDICEFTGFKESPWWEDTYAVVIKCESGFILYGEITPSLHLKVGSSIKEGDLIGSVKKVLKKDKGITPTSMLHLELYDIYTEPVWWVNKQPENLKDITNLLWNQKRIN
jgi:hypothetical protein